MMECRKALDFVLTSSSNGDQEVIIAAALDHLRVHAGGAIASKLAARSSASTDELNHTGPSVRVWPGEGACSAFVSGDGSTGLALVTADTDFCARGATLSSFADAVARSVAMYDEGEGEVDPEKLLKWDCKLKEAFDAALLSVRENVRIAATYRLPSPEGDERKVVSAKYLHNKALDGLSGSSAAVVRLYTPETPSAFLEGEAHKLAMHIVAARPSYLDRSVVPSEVSTHEKSIILARAQAAGTLAGKPEKVQESILEGMMNKFYKEKCLSEQAHLIVEGGPVVGKYLKKEGNLKILDYVHFQSRGK